MLSLAAYKDFLALWKDAYAGIPVYQQAKAEYAKDTTKSPLGGATTDHKSFPQTSPAGDGRIQSPARECREKKPTETKSPLGDATTNLLVRLPPAMRNARYRVPSSIAMS